MVGPSSPMFLPLAHSAASVSPRHHDGRNRNRDATPLHQPPDPCLSALPSNSGSPNFATEFRVGSPSDVAYPTAEGASAYAGSDDDAEMCDTEADNSHHQSEGTNLPASARTAIERATKRFRSQCWKEFEPILEDGVVVEGRCKHCDTVMAAKRGSGTSSLLTHLKRCKKRSRNLRLLQDLSSTLRSPSGTSLKDWSYDPDLSRYELMRMISLHELPFLFLEYDGVRRFLATLNPLFKMPCRTTGRTCCLKAFHEKKLELKEMFKNAGCRFSLTADMWTSNQTLGYIVVTCHFIDADWKLQKRIIKFMDVKTPHTGAELYNSIQKCIQDWSIEDKLFGITLDNAAANNTMVDLLKTNLVSRNLLPAKGQLMHHRCAGHVINLIVKSGLQVVEQVVVNIRESVKYIRSSVSRKQMFKEIVTQEGITSKKKPGLDVITRWNSTYLMLKTALKFRLAFEKLESEDQKYAHAPSSDEWEKAEVLCRLLKVYKRATKVISGTKYPTSNLYFHLMWKIKITLEETLLQVEVAQTETSHEVEVDENATLVQIAKVLNYMKQKFDKYWNKSYVLLCVPVVFDPRFKLKFIDFIFKESFPTKAQLRFARVENLVRSLYDSYSSQETESNVASTSQGVLDLGLPSTKNDPWAAWDRQLNNDLQSKRSTELDRYLDDDPVPRSQEFDILKWWMGNESKYPVLARIARDLLAIPASSVASESAFSTSERIISDSRSSLTPEIVEALICTQDWYRAEGSSEFNMSSINDHILCDDNTRL